MRFIFISQGAFLLGKWVTRAVIFQQKRAFITSKLFVLAISLLGSFHNHFRSPNSQCCFWLLATLFPLIKGVTAPPRLYYGTGVCMWERRVRGMYSFTRWTVAKCLSSCWMHGKRTFISPYTNRTKAYAWDSAANPRQGHGARRDRWPQGIAQEFEESQVGSCPCCTKAAATMPCCLPTPLRPAPDRHYGDKRLGKTIGLY